jgi:hypothetical protein
MVAVLARYASRFSVRALDLTLALENPPSPYLRDEIQRLLDEGTTAPGSDK